MQGAEFGNLSMWRSRRHRKPICRKWQFKNLPQIELGVKAQMSRLERRRIPLAKNRKLTSIERCRALAGSISHLNRELRRIIIKDGKNQCRSGFGVRMDVVWKVAPHDIPGRRLLPPTHHHAVSVSNRLERTDLFFAAGTAFLIWRTCAAVSGPSSCSY